MDLFTISHTPLESLISALPPRRGADRTHLSRAHSPSPLYPPLKQRDGEAAQTQVRFKFYAFWWTFAHVFPYITRLRSVATCEHLDARQFVLISLHLLNACTEMYRLNLVAFLQTHPSLSGMGISSGCAAPRWTGGWHVRSPLAPARWSRARVHLNFHSSTVRAGSACESAGQVTVRFGTSPKFTHSFWFRNKWREAQCQRQRNVVWLKIAGDCRNISACSCVILRFIITFGLILRLYVSRMDYIHLSALQLSDLERLVL